MTQEVAFAKRFLGVSLNRTPTMRIPPSYPREATARALFRGIRISALHERFSLHDQHGFAGTVLSAICNQLGSDKNNSFIRKVGV
jgi:hypothetical protein